MSKNQRVRKLRRFFTAQALQEHQEDLWLEPSETHHLRDLIRLKPEDVCLITDGKGCEVEAVILKFTADDKTHLRVVRTTKASNISTGGIFLRVMPALLRKGKTDLLVEKAQELGADEMRPLFSERCEVKIAKEKVGKIMDRWDRIAREASKQSGALKMIPIREPQDFKEALGAIPAGEPVAIFHPCPDAVAFSEWFSEIREVKGEIKALNIFIGPEGGFSEDEISWARWNRKGKKFWVVELGEVRLKADTAFVGILASLRFSGILST